MALQRTSFEQGSAHQQHGRRLTDHNPRALFSCSSTRQRLGPVRHDTRLLRRHEPALCFIQHTSYSSSIQHASLVYYHSLLSFTRASRHLALCTRRPPITALPRRDQRGLAKPNQRFIFSSIFRCCCIKYYKLHNVQQRAGARTLPPCNCGTAQPRAFAGSA